MAPIHKIGRSRYDLDLVEQQRSASFPVSPVSQLGILQIERPDSVTWAAYLAVTVPKYSGAQSAVEVPCTKEDQSVNQDIIERLFRPKKPGPVTPEELRQLDDLLVERRRLRASYRRRLLDLPDSLPSWVAQDDFDEGQKE